MTTEEEMPADQLRQIEELRKQHHPVTMEELATYARRRLQRNQWFFMPFFGAPGSGKSSDMLQFARMIQPDFDPLRQVVFTPDEYKAARRTFPKGSVIVVDEFIKTGGNRLRSQTDVSVALMEDVNTNRKRGHAVIGGQPFRDDFPPRIIKHAHWTAEKDGNFVGTAFEARVIGFRKKVLWEEPRFNFKLEECEVAAPELWRPYLRRAMEDGAGRGEDLLARQERIKDFRQVALSLPAVRSAA